MRKILSIWFAVLLLFASPLYAGQILRGSSGAPCATPTTANVLHEGFIGGYENVGAWSDALGAGGSATPDFTLAGTPPTESCSKGLQVIASGASSAIRWDNGEAIDISANTLKFVLEFSVTSWTIDNDGYVSILSWTTTSSDMTSAETFWVRLTEDAETLHIRVDPTTTEAVIETGICYTATVYLDSGTPSNSYFQITGGTTSECDVVGECTFTPTDVDGRYLWVGPGYGVGATEAVTIEVGYVSINIEP